MIVYDKRYPTSISGQSTYRLGIGHAAHNAGLIIVLICRLSAFDLYMSQAGSARHRINGFRILLQEFHASRLVSTFTRGLGKTSYQAWTDAVSFVSVFDPDT